jgi:hypothetical protein
MRPWRAVTSSTPRWAAMRTIRRCAGLRLDEPRGRGRCLAAVHAGAHLHLEPRHRNQACLPPVTQRRRRYIGRAQRHHCPVSVGERLTPLTRGCSRRGRRVRASQGGMDLGGRRAANQATPAVLVLSRASLDHAGGPARRPRRRCLVSDAWASKPITRSPPWVPQEDHDCQHESRQQVADADGAHLTPNEHGWSTQLTRSWVQTGMTPPTRSQGAGGGSRTRRALPTSTSCSRRPLALRCSRRVDAGARRWRIERHA